MENVTQGDRDAAASFAEWQNNAAGFADGLQPFFVADFPAAVREGSWDNHPLVEFFAAHRLQSQEPMMEVQRACRMRLSVLLDTAADFTEVDQQNCEQVRDLITKLDTILSGEVDRG